MEETIKEYNLHKENIKSRLNDFKKLSEKEKFHELLFCLLTPQSNAKKCWEAVEQLKKINNFDKNLVANILRTRTRFHNNKSRYILEAQERWNFILPQLENNKRKELRNWLAENMNGLWYKEAGHFLRNIG